MKKLLFSLSLLASVAAFAGESTIDAGTYALGVMPITSTETNVIVCVPWVATSCTGGTSAISVTNLIQTTNLTEGDWIRVWDNANNQFKVWSLSGGVWTPANVVSGKGVAAGGISSDTTLQRGDAVVLYRQNAATAPVFYINGQYAALSGSETTTMATGSLDTQAYTLVAPPFTSGTEVNLNENVTWQNLAVGDYLMLKYYKNNKWVTQYFYYDEYHGSFGYPRGSTWVDPKIAVGQGCWFITTNTTAVTVKWSKSN